jgi:hypothetical protein
VTCSAGTGSGADGIPAPSTIVINGLGDLDSGQGMEIVRKNDKSLIFGNRPKDLEGNS